MITHEELGEATFDYYISGYATTTSFGTYIMENWLTTLHWPHLECEKDNTTVMLVLQSFAEYTAGRTAELFNNYPMPKLKPL